MRALGDLIGVFLALGVVPLLPALAASHAGWPWEAVALAGVWSACWYLWLAAQVRARTDRTEQ